MSTQVHGSSDQERLRNLPEALKEAAENFDRRRKGQVVTIKRKGKEITLRSKSLLRPQPRSPLQALKRAWKEWRYDLLALSAQSRTAGKL